MGSAARRVGIAVVNRNAREPVGLRFCGIAMDLPLRCDGLQDGYVRSIILFVYRNSVYVRERT